MSINLETKIPTTIAEAVDLIVDGLDEKEREVILNNPSESMHFSAGMGLRNGWGLWQKDSPVKLDAVKTYGIAHADDLSGLIMEWAWAKVRGEDFDPFVYCKKYEDHWAKYGITPLEAGNFNPDGTPK
jgi:hypothetical protein